MRAVRLLVVVAACGGAQRAAPPAREEVRVRVEGNREVSDGTLLDGLALTRALAAGQTLDPYLVAADRDRLLGYYVRKGYLAVEVTWRIDEAPGATDVVYQVREGPRAFLEAVELDGLPAEIDPAQVREMIALRDGGPFDYEPYDEAKARLTAPLARAGYAHARAEAAVLADAARGAVVIRVRYDPGPLCTFGEVKVAGIPAGLEKSVRARIRIREGDRYSTDALELTQALLYEMKRFAIVRVEPRLGGADPVVPVTIEVVPSEEHEVRLGGGFGLDPESVELHGRAARAFVGWPQPLAVTRLDLRPAAVVYEDEREVQPQVEASAVIERLDLLRTDLTGAVEGTIELLQLEAYTSAGPGIRLSLRTPLGVRWINALVGWELRVLQFHDLDPAVDAATAHELGLDVDLYRLGFFEQALVIDRRDDPVAPSRGAYGALRLGEGLPAAGGDFTFLQLTPEVRGYVTPRRRMTLAARARLGVFLGDVPVTERYYAGGASSQRGFAGRRLSPVATQVVDGVEERVVIGGGASIETNLEARLILGTLFGQRLGVVAFLDGGDVTETWPALDVTHLHWAAGSGLRLATPIGPVRVDVGYRLNRTGPGEPEPDRKVAFHLSLGEAF